MTSRGRQVSELALGASTIRSGDFLFVHQTLPDPNGDVCGRAQFRRLSAAGDALLRFDGQDITVKATDFGCLEPVRPGEGRSRFR